LYPTSGAYSSLNIYNKINDYISELKLRSGTVLYKLTIKVQYPQLDNKLSVGDKEVPNKHTKLPITIANGLTCDEKPYQINIARGCKLSFVILTTQQISITTSNQKDVKGFPVHFSDVIRNELRSAESILVEDTELKYLTQYQEAIIVKPIYLNRLTILEYDDSNSSKCNSKFVSCIAATNATANVTVTREVYSLNTYNELSDQTAAAKVLETTTVNPDIEQVWYNYTIDKLVLDYINQIIEYAEDSMQTMTAALVQSDRFNAIVKGLSRILKSNKLDEFEDSKTRSKIITDVKNSLSNISSINYDTYNADRINGIFDESSDVLENISTAIRLNRKNN
jgi:hypothetical protein